MLYKKDGWYCPKCKKFNKVRGVGWKIRKCKCGFKINIRTEYVQYHYHRNEIKDILNV